jgi:hypothetical protein
MKIPTNEVTLLEGKALFGPLHKLSLRHGNSASTRCDLFTAAEFLVVKTNTGDFKAPAEGELWPPVQLTMQQVKQIAKLYARSAAPVHIERSAQRLKVDSTGITL